MDCSSNNRRQGDSILADLVSDYIEKYRGKMKRYLRDYKDQLTLRIGAKLGLYPKAVYLHGEVISGAKALGLNYRQKSIPIKDIPEPISSNLEPYEIEGFFCRYKEELKDLRL